MYAINIMKLEGNSAGIYSTQEERTTLVMAKILSFLKKSMEYKVKYSITGNGVAQMNARDILNTREAKEQIKAAKAVVGKS